MATYPLSEAFTDGQVLTAANVNTTNEGVNDVALPIYKYSTSTSYAPALTDGANVVAIGNASAITVTLPSNATTAFPNGTQIMFFQASSGQITFAAGAGATMGAQGGKTKIAGQWGMAGAYKYDTDAWIIFGNLVV
jgi:hypothetical protein